MLREKSQDFKRTISGLQEAQACIVPIMMQNQVKEPRMNLPKNLKEIVPRFKGSLIKDGLLSSFNRISIQ